MSSSMKVAMVEPVGGHGGLNFYDFPLCANLVKAGVSATLYTCDKTAVNGQEGFSIKRPYVRIYGSDPAWQRGLRFLWGSLKALGGARLGGARLAHFHFFHIGVLEFFNVLLARLLGMKVVITAHDVEAFKADLSVKQLVDRSYAMAHAVIAHNQISRQELIDRIGLPANKIHVIRHGNYEDYVNVKLDHAEACRAIGLDPADFNLVFFGQIKEVKGVDVLLKALPAIKQGVTRKVKLTIAGKVWKDDFSKYQALIDQLHLQNDVNLQIRYVPDAELPQFYAAADLMALPYKRIYQSGVVLMSMSFGRPVIVSDIPGMLEVVTHGQTGLVFKSEDPADLARQIVTAANQPGLLDTLSTRGHEHVTNAYSWKKIGEETAKCYRSVANV